MKLKLILGDQLNLQHSWFKEVDSREVFVLMEMRQETDYAPHHIQKVVAFLAQCETSVKYLSKRVIKYII